MGLALATSLSALLNAGLLWWGLRRDGVYHAQPGWLRFALRLLVATLAMAALLVWLVPPTADWLVWGWQRKAWEMTLLVTGGMLIYLVVLFALGLRLRELRAGQG